MSYSANGAGAESSPCSCHDAGGPPLSGYSGQAVGRARRPSDPRAVTVRPLEPRPMYGPRLGTRGQLGNPLLLLAPLLPKLKPYAGTIIGAASDVARHFLGGSNATSCPGQFSGMQLRNLLVSVTDAELTQLYNAFNLVNPGSVQPYFNGVDLDWMAFAIAGGSDCKVSTTNGKAMVALVNQLFQKYPQAMQSAPITDTGGGFPAGSSLPPIAGAPSGNPIIISDPGPVLRADPVTRPDAGPALPVLKAAPDDSWLDKVKDVFTDSLKAAGKAAAQSALPAAYGALPPAQQAQLDQYAAAQYAKQAGSSVSGMLPWLLGGAVVLGGIALATRRR